MSSVLCVGVGSLLFTELSPPVTRRQDRSSPVSCPVTGQETPIGKCLLRHQEASCHQETKILLSTGQEDSYHKPTGGDPSPVGLPKVNLTIGLGRVWAPPKVLQSGVNIRK